MSTNTKNNRVQQLAAEQKLIDGTQQFLSHVSTLPVGSQNVTPADIKQVFEDRIAKGRAAVAATDARTAAVKADRDERKKTQPFVNAFKRIVVGMFLQSPDTLGVFGLKPPKVAKKTAAEKAATVVKVKATRTARGPIGRKQRAKVKASAATTSGETASGATTSGTTASGATGATASGTRGASAATGATTSGSTASGASPPNPNPAAGPAPKAGA
jgi:hypothetical protein